MTKRAWECPCGSFRVVASRRADPRLVDAALGAHLKECVVAQADVIARQAAPKG